MFPEAHAKQPKLLATGTVYHKILTTSTCVNRMARRQKGNTGKYAGGGSNNSLREMWRVSIDETHFSDLRQISYFCCECFRQCFHEA